MPDEIYAWVAERFSEILEIDPEEITSSSQFAEDLDADSIDLIEVVNQAEAKWGIAIDEEEIYDIENVGQLVDALRSTIEAKG